MSSRVESRIIVDRIEGDSDVEYVVVVSCDDDCDPYRDNISAMATVDGVPAPFAFTPAERECAGKALDEEIHADDRNY